MSTAPVTGPVAMNITSRMDGMYWGVLISVMFFGITISQGWSYAHNNKDKWHLRLLVTLLILMDFTITSLNCHALRFYLMSNFGNPPALLTLTKTMMAAMSVDMIAIYLTTLFFASQIYIFDKHSLWAVILVAFLATCYFATFAWALDGIRKDPYFSNLSHPLMKLRGGIAFAFLMVSVMIMSAVLHTKSACVHISIKRTQTILQQLHVFIVTRGLLVTLNAVVLFIVFMAQTNSMHWIPFLFFESKVHVISMVAMLNTQAQPASQLDKNVISMGNIRSSARAFSSFLRNPVAGGHRIEPQVMHLANLPDIAGKHGDMMKIHERGLEISVEKSVQVTEY
ncbi:hypothetical protein L208DRAFT_1410536 [Tricholoma matsutake]|nr:hypothetical protein L208DRAFT_1410532 [Tricholoma matsutake 945]KAF8224300.1 hypothetical protein L208DRAFT_1410536 [Tricholoma matsutake 945]